MVKEANTVIDMHNRISATQLEKVLRMQISWKVKGFGGTDFRPVFEYVQKKMQGQPDLLLFFTDGCGNAPNTPPHYPVMWILTSDGAQPAA